jgi:hypothetical protein
MTQNILLITCTTCEEKENVTSIYYNKRLCIQFICICIYYDTRHKLLMRERVVFLLVFLEKRRHTISSIFFEKILLTKYQKHRCGNE